MDDTLRRARRILRAEAEAIRSVPLDKHFQRAVGAIVRCKGKVITTGIGKAGAVARKIAGTFCSNGVPAAFLHPGEAGHGDLGLLAPGDIVLAFSTSGKTREVLEMLELARHLGVRCMIGVTSHPDSLIHRLCPIVINMGAITEPCPLGLTPSASSAVMMAIGDALSLVAMQERGFTRHDYGLRHHAGYLGQKARAGGGPRATARRRAAARP
jgi:arabinose-5-phosphate isomerase